MSHEISQLDIPDRQLLATNTQARVSLSREIGEAVITHTIFGKAKVRIIRKDDNIRRARLLAALAAAATAIAVATWLVWDTSKQSGPLQSTPLPPESEKVQEIAPEVQSENFVPAAPPSVQSEPMTPPPAEIRKPAIARKSAPQPVQGLKGDGQKTAKTDTDQPKPVADRPLKAGKLQTTPLAASGNASKSQTDRLPSSELPPPKQPVAPAVAAPSVTKSAPQSEAESPADATPLASPIGKEDTTSQSPASDKQPAAPVDAQGK
jgi:hypothetical protein